MKADPLSIPCSYCKAVAGERCKKAYSWVGDAPDDGHLVRQIVAGEMSAGRLSGPPTSLEGVVLGVGERKPERLSAYEPSFAPVTAPPASSAASSLGTALPSSPDADTSDQFQDW